MTAYGVDGSSSSFTLGSFSTSLDGVALDDSALIDSTNYAITQGLRLAHADIAYITIKGDGVVMDNLTFTTPVPEPQAYALMLAGLGVVAFAARRRLHKA
ncbi:MAG: PEP-CTERM sorting domain-containing protein [Pseudomonadota bacterium]